MEGYIFGVFILTVVATGIVYGIRKYGQYTGSHYSPEHQTKLFRKVR